MVSNKIVTILAAKKDNQEQDLTLVFAEIPVYNLPKPTTISLLKYSSTLFPSQYYAFLQLDFKVKSIYSLQISKHAISTE